MCTRKPALWSNTCIRTEKPYMEVFGHVATYRNAVNNLLHGHSPMTYIRCHHEINGQYNLLWLANRHPVSVATYDDSEYAQFTQPFTVTYNSHCPHLHPVQEVCPKGLTQLLHYLLVATASCKQNCSPAILREGCKNRRYMKWAIVLWKRGSNIQRSKQW